MNLVYDELIKSFVINEFYGFKDAPDMPVKITVRTDVIGRESNTKSNNLTFMEIALCKVDKNKSIDLDSVVCSIQVSYDQQTENINYFLLEIKPKVRKISNDINQPLKSFMFMPKINFGNIKDINIASMVLEMLDNISEKLYKDVPYQIIQHIEKLLGFNPSDFMVQDYTIKEDKKTQDTKHYYFKYMEIFCRGTAQQPEMCLIKNLYNNETNLKIEFNGLGKYIFTINNDNMPIFFNMYKGISFDPMEVIKNVDEDGQIQQWLMVWMYSIAHNILYPEKQDTSRFSEVFRTTEDNLTFFYNFNFIEKNNCQITTIGDEQNPIFLSMIFYADYTRKNEKYIFSIDYRDNTVYIADEQMKNQHIAPDELEFDEKEIIINRMYLLFKEDISERQIDYILSEDGQVMKFLNSIINDN